MWAALWVGKPWSMDPMEIMVGTEMVAKPLEVREVRAKVVLDKEREWKWNKLSYISSCVEEDASFHRRVGTWGPAHLCMMSHA